MGKQPTIGQKKSKEAIARAAASSRKGLKKKWSKGKVKEKLNNFVLIDPKLLGDMERQIPNMKIITISSIVEKFKVVGGIAKQVLRYLISQGKVNVLPFSHHQFQLYTGANAKEVGAEEEKKEAKGKGGKGAKDAAKEVAKEATA